MLRRWRNEPLVHFVALGLLLFAVHRLFAARPPRERIVVTPAFVAGLRDDAKKRSGRELTRAEEDAAIQRFVDEEMLYREALSLGLDRGDVIVRRRLIQKMEFLTRGKAGEPSDAELRSFLEQHRERYDTPARLSLRHIFLGEERHGFDARVDWQKQGKPFLQGRQWTRRSEKELAAIFGDELAHTLMSQPTGQWLGPLRSRYGMHLVHIDDKTEPRAAEIDDRLRADWNLEQQRNLDLSSLRARYQVERP